MQCEGQGDAVDLDGDVGAVGRFYCNRRALAARGRPPLQRVTLPLCVRSDGAMRLDLKGVIYRASLQPCATLLVVRVDEAETARVESVGNAFMALEEEAAGAAEDEDGYKDGFAMADADEVLRFADEGGGGGEAAGGGGAGGKKKKKRARAGAEEEDGEEGHDIGAYVRARLTPTPGGRAADARRPRRQTWRSRSGAARRAAAPRRRKCRRSGQGGRPRGGRRGRGARGRRDARADAADTTVRCSCPVWGQGLCCEGVRKSLAADTCYRPTGPFGTQLGAAGRSWTQLGAAGRRALQRRAPGLVGGVHGAESVP